jgi:integrase
VVERVRTALGLADFTSHDLRRTATTRMAAMSFQPHVVEAILNHSGGIISGVARIYNRHAYEKEKRFALERWAKEVARVANPSLRLKPKNHFQKAALYRKFRQPA